MKEEIIITENFVIKDINFLLNEAPLNYLYDKDVFFTSGLNHHKYHMYGMVGILGGHPNDYELDNSIKVFVISDSLWTRMKNGFKDEIIKLLETKLNAKGQLLKDVIVITETSLIDFIKKRASNYSDAVLQNLLNHLEAI